MEGVVEAFLASCANQTAWPIQQINHGWDYPDFESFGYPTKLSSAPLTYQFGVQWCPTMTNNANNTNDANDTNDTKNQEAAQGNAFLQKLLSKIHVGATIRNEPHATLKNAFWVEITFDSHDDVEVIVKYMTTCV